MDPAPVTASMDSVSVAAFVALAMGLMEIIKQLVNWLGKKITGKDSDKTTLMVQLDPEVSRIIHESGEQVKAMSAVVFKTDNDGVPLVYSDRKAEENVNRLSDSMKDLAVAQRHLADSMARLDASFAAHDKSDAIVFAKMADTMARIESIASTNKEHLLGFHRDHQQALAKLEEIKKSHEEHDRRVMQAVSMQQEILGKIDKK